jgi:hypothetical protein
MGGGIGVGDISLDFFPYPPHIYIMDLLTDPPPPKTFEEKTNNLLRHKPTSDLEQDLQLQIGSLQDTIEETRAILGASPGEGVTTAARRVMNPRELGDLETKLLGIEGDLHRLLDRSRFPAPVRDSLRDALDAIVAVQRVINEQTLEDFAR